MHKILTLNNISPLGLERLPKDRFQVSSDLKDPDGKRAGIMALQIHSGPAMEVRFKNLKLEVK